MCVPGNYVAGAEKTNIETIKLLKNSGYNLHCIISGWNDGVFKKILVEEKVPFTELKLGAFYLRKIWWTLDTLVNFIPAFFRFIFIYRAFNPSVVFFSAPWQLYLFGRFFKNSNVIFREHNYPAATRQNKLLYRSIKKHCKSILVSSKYIAESVMEFGIESHQILIVPSLIKESKDYTPVLKKSETINIGIVGQVLRRKGHDILLSALLKLEKSKQEELKLYIIGPLNIGYQEELKKLLSEQKFYFKIIWTGNFDGSKSLYKEFELDLVIVPSRIEAFGRVAIEPAFASIPVIASKTGGLKEIILHDTTGFLFENENDEDLKGHIERYLNDRALMRVHGKKARELAEKRFSFATVAEKTLRAFC